MKKKNMQRTKREARKPRSKRPGKRRPKSIFIGLIFWLLLFSLLFTLFLYQREGAVKMYELSYSDFDTQVQDSNVVAVIIAGKEIRGEFRVPIVNEKEVEFKNFKTLMPFENSEQLVSELISCGIKVEGKSFFSIWGKIAPYAVFFVVLLIFWMFLFRQAGRVPAEAMRFGQSRARRFVETEKITFNDVAGVDEAKEELKEVIEFLKSPQKFKRLGAKIPKGVLLVGAPGTGKTLLARATAGEAKVPFFTISGSDFVELFVGVGASRVRDLFSKGKKSAPDIIFIDELDAVGRYRGAGIGSGHDEREQTLNALLVEMDGFEANKGIIVMAATNRPDVLDPALLRPGRFDRRIVVDRPDLKGREAIFKVHTKKIPLAKEVDIEVLARGTPGFSGADIANMANEAALVAAKKRRKKVEQKDFEEARDKILMGVERKSLIVSDSERRNTAYHEAGHVLVSKFLPEADPIHKVTIIPRGIALGVTQHLPVDERRNHSREYCVAQLAVLHGGRTAEQIALKTITTGARNDIEQATELAHRMVCEWGMSDTVGPITFGKKREEVFLGREIAQHRDFSEETAKVIDKEVRKLIREAGETAKDIIVSHINVLHKIAKFLLEKEVLTGAEIDGILKRKKKAIKK